MRPGSRNAAAWLTYHPSHRRSSPGQSKMEDALILIGMSGVGLLWAFAAIGALASIWDTFGNHVSDIIEKLKGYRG